MNHHSLCKSDGMDWICHVECPVRLEAEGKFKDRYSIYIEGVALADAQGVQKKDKEYGGSWKQRGGVGAFMMVARKWDRIEKTMQQEGYDIFKAIEHDGRDEGIIDDIRDLRRYLILIESEMIARRVIDEEGE